MNLIFPVAKRIKISATVIASIIAVYIGVSTLGAAASHSKGRPPDSPTVMYPLTAGLTISFSKGGFYLLRETLLS